MDVEHEGPVGVAGASAQYEYERRRARDQLRLRRRWGPLGGVAVALSPERASTLAWQRGAVGEQRLGARLDRLAPLGLGVLHDRRVPRSRANIDHIVVTRSAIWVIDAKRYCRQRPRLRIDGGVLRPRTERLTVGGRDRTRLLDGVQRQVDLVEDILDRPARGVLCFIDADWPLIGGTFTIRGIQVTPPGRLVRGLRRQLDGEVDVRGTVRLLALALRAA